MDKQEFLSMLRWTGILVYAVVALIVLYPAFAAKKLWVRITK